jgi:N6-L-threonylcarbamoyladenine synthase
MILGIETSCDEIAAAIVDKNFKVKKNIIFSSCQLAKEAGGVVPEMAARDAAEKISEVLSLATKKIEWKKISAIAVTNGPGLAGPLMTGIEAAKTLAVLHQKPLIPVFHIFGHMSANFLERKPEKVLFPSLVLTVSGGHNDLYLWKSPLEYQKLGGTIDDAAGECFDKCARMLGLPYPGGPSLSQCAESGDAKKYPFPKPLCQKNHKSSENKYNFSFSGLKTALFYKLREENGLENISIETKANLSASIQSSIVETLLTKLFWAAEEFSVPQIHITGGVSANTLLKKRFIHEAEKRNISGIFPQKNVYSTDNGAMIAAAAQLIWQNTPEKNFPSESVEMDLKKY